MLLTITTTRAPATDLGYLLHKHPDRVQAFATAAGTAHVFYPEATLSRTRTRTRARAANADAFTAAYLRYCWPTDQLAGVRVAPFQLLASEGATYHERPHLWHLDLAGRLAAADQDLKVRGREYLRLIYGPDYTEPANLARLRERGLGHKRSLALREYALGLEALDRVARGEPLWRVHECVFAVLALESEPVDPRL